MKRKHKKRREGRKRGGIRENKRRRKKRRKIKINFECSEASFSTFNHSQTP